MSNSNRFTPSVSKNFQDATEGKTFCNPEEACEYYLTGIGINAKFLPMEYKTLYPSIVRSKLGKYSVGISTDSYCENHGCAVALVVICMENITPGFVKSYIKNPTMIDENPHCSEIIHMQSILLKIAS